MKRYAAKPKKTEHWLNGFDGWKRISDEEKNVKSVKEALENFDLYPDLVIDDGILKKNPLPSTIIDLTKNKLSPSKNFKPTKEKAFINSVDPIVYSETMLDIFVSINKGQKKVLNEI